jgi:hypothetical protein
VGKAEDALGAYFLKSKGRGEWRRRFRHLAQNKTAVESHFPVLIAKLTWCITITGEYVGNAEDALGAYF